jgi:hypothetical protein
MIVATMHASILAGFNRIAENLRCASDKTFRQMA